MKRMLLGSALLALGILFAVREAPGSSPDTNAADSEQSVAAFRDVATVLRSPRCINCHVAGDHPRQGDDHHVHSPSVSRGPDGRGVPGLRCTNCHQATNLESPGAPPGAADWQMPRADLPMVWEGLSVGDLCRAITDPSRNGHRKPADLVAHMRTSLVVWAWAPGPERTLPPLAYDKFMCRLNDWIATGAACEK